MIRVNLLPAEERREVKGLGGVVLAVLTIVAVLFIVAALDLWKSSQIASSKQRLQDIRQEVKALEKIKQKVEEFKVKNKELEDRIQLIKVLEDNRTGPLFVMDSLGNAIPERAWLDKVTERSFSATLEGVAWNEKTVAEFMRQLQSSPYFSGVELREIKTQEIRSLPLKTFKIQTNFNYSGKTKTEEVGEETTTLYTPDSANTGG